MGSNWQRTRNQIKHSILIRSLRILAIGLFFMSMEVGAKDFGVVGHRYAILEEDIIEYIKKKLANVDIEALNKEMQEKVKANVKRPTPVSDIGNATEDREYYYDPTYVLNRDIYDHNNKLLHTKGKTINPLSKVPLSNTLIFIDGDDDKQVQYALELYRKLESKAKIILINGSPIELEEKHKIWIYFDQFGYLTKKFGIQHVPATVTQAGLKLKIHEVALK